MSIKRSGMVFMLLAFGVPVACDHAPGPNAETAAADNAIDQRSYRLGSLGAFAEIVSLGIKELALSSAVPGAEMDAMMADAERIAREHDVQLYREADFLVTDLFPLSATEDKEVLLIYRGDTLKKYQALKAQKGELLSSGRYTGEDRRSIARLMGKLLSYPDAKIAELIDDNTDGREP